MTGTLSVIVCLTQILENCYSSFHPMLLLRLSESWEVRKWFNTQWSLISQHNTVFILIHVSSGSPPSPAPPLPERTPESYELYTDKGKYYLIFMSCVYNKHKTSCQIFCFVITVWINLYFHSAPVEQNESVTPAVNLNRVGTSSEWSGNSLQETSEARDETKSWARSKVRIKPPLW